MKQNKLPLNTIFKQAKPVLEAIQRAGFEAYFVGGSIRDALLDLPVNDVDIATSAQPEEIKAIFKRTVDVGIEHGTVLVLWHSEPYEVTTFRTEDTYADHRRPDHVTFVRSLKEDLKRRDFTMNAIALASDGTLIDYFDGQKAIAEHLIETVGVADERFNEDALRMMRAVRFQSQLGFKLAIEAVRSIAHYNYLLEKISIERIQIEFEKLLLGKARSFGLKTMLATELYKFCPGFSQAKKPLTDLATTQYPVQNDSEAWALLCYFMSKHDEFFNVRSFLKAWKLSNRLIEQVEITLVGFVERPIDPTADAWYLFKYGRDVLERIEHLRIVLDQKNALQDILTAYDCLPIKTSQELAVSGRDLLASFDKNPGPWVGKYLNLLLKKVVTGQIQNTKTAILDYLNQTVK